MWFRRYLSRRGIRHSIPQRKNRRRRPGGQPAYDRKLSKKRYIIEQVNRKFEGYRRLITRFERLGYVHWGLLHVAAIMICLRYVLR